MKNVIVFFFVLLSLSIHAQNKPVLDLQNVIDTFIANNLIPGIAVSVIKLDTVMYAVSGVTKKNENNPIQATSKFHLGSNTKAITSFIAAKLIEEGKIKWDTKLVEVLPELKTAIHSKFQDITLEQLLSHTAGIKAYTNLKEFATLPEFVGTMQNQRYLWTKHTLTNDTLLTVGNYTYSNAGYVIASLMLSKIMEKPWEQQVKEIFQKCGISDFYIGFPNRENITNPWGHWLAGGDTLQAVSPSIDYDISIVAPAGDISMNIFDYSKFIQINLKGICGNDNYLKAETYQKLHFGKEKYALGWGNGKNSFGTVSTHSGSAGNFYCHTMLFKEKQIALIVMVNASSKSVDDSVIQLRRQLFSLYNPMK
jgi:D-alanyl-D-alanine carboxypeptidase